ncbi:uncharacterized protein CDAR_439621 [Caerostris darwini]|uniref:Uncharacterized protein n=1 Tax=Caerostris darwini TaxID=1538125 RepID=A0AAV4MJF8_9ARAC|nr:uncharacterized protein CDAR_439621 [Caerostris darwini]
MSFFAGQIINHQAYFKNYDRGITFNYSCNSLPRHFLTYCHISTRYDICWNLTPIWQGGIMDAISRVLTLGGVSSLEIFHVILLTSYHLSFTLQEGTVCKQCSSLHMKINLDPDYEAAIGNSGTEFQKFTLHHLRAMFSKIHLDVHDLSLQKGSIQLSFLLKYTDTHDYLYVEDNFTSLFQVPNHLQITMKKKMFYIQTHPTSEDKSRRLFYTLEFLKNQMNIKYPLLSHYINIYVFNKLQNFSSYNNQRAFSLDEEESSFTHEKPKHETRPEFDSNRLEKTSSLGDSNLKKLNSKNIHPKIDEVSEKDMEFEAPLLSSFSTKISKINQKSRIRRNVQTSTKDSNLRLKVRFSFQTPVKSDTNNEEFQKHLKKQLARKMRVPLPSIEAMKIASGNMI